MKARRILAILVLAALLLVGCSNTVNDWDAMWDTALLVGETADDPQIRQLTESMLDAIIADEQDTAYDLLIPGIDRSAFNTAYQQLRPVLENMGVYTLAAYQVNTNKNLGTGASVKTICYLLSGGENARERSGYMWRCPKTLNILRNWPAFTLMSMRK